MTSNPIISLKKTDLKLYSHLHYWARKNVPKPTTCNRCGENKKLELSNNSGKYIADIKDWEWICKSCHAKKDKWGDLEKAWAARRGKPSWNKGVKLSKEHRQNLSESHKGKHHEGTFKPGDSPWTKGRKLSEEHRRKIGKANKKRVKEYWRKKKLGLL